MILSLAIFKALVAGLVTAAAWLLDYGFEKRGWPRRWLWITAVVLTCALPLFAVSRDWAPRAQGQPISLGSIENPGTGVIGLLRSDYQQILVTRPQFDGALDNMTLAIRTGGILVLMLGWLAQHMLLRGAHPTTIDGTTIFVSAQSGPAVLGFFKPKILIPEWMTDLPTAVGDLALAHERAHIRAGDPLCFFALLLFATAAADVASIGFVLWQICRFRFAVEVDCDRRVLATVDRQQYAQALLTIARQRCGAFVGAMALVERTSDLERRLRVMTMDRDNARSPRIQLAMLCSFTLLAAAAALDAPLQPYPRLVQWVHTHKETTLAPQVLTRYAGIYVTKAGAQPTQFRVEGSRLVALSAPEAAAFRAGDMFAPTGEDDFLLVTPPRRTTRLSFVDFDKDGRPSRVIENNRGSITVFRRLPDTLQP